MPSEYILGCSFFLGGSAFGLLLGVVLMQRDVLLKQANITLWLNRADHHLTRRNEISTAMAYDLRRFVEITDEMTRAEQPKPQTTSGA